MPERFGEQFLHQKNSKLHTSEQIENTQERRRSRGQETSQKPAEKLGAYLDRLEAILQPEPASEAKVAESSVVDEGGNWRK